MKKRPVQTANEGALDSRQFTVNDLFPDTLPPVFAARWPAPNSRADNALAALLTGPQNQADYADGWRLAAYIRELRDLGWAIVTHSIIRLGCRRPITEYRLDLSDPATRAALVARWSI